ncbi:zinc ribbon domain-containing protein [Kribbella sp. C-35]|uniref:zinc ribbon domain-containing protein n=1 Tax=Kribbella sp. C-35 TaxID=2789276 RepID=UPI00397D9DFD
MGRRSRPPRYVEQARQLTEARADNEWLRAGSQTVQQQALRDRRAKTRAAIARLNARERDRRESQAVFRCRSCSYSANADVNAAVNIAAGRAVNARGAPDVLGAEKRELQLPTSA